MSTCECAACGTVFSSLASFDAHQSVDYDRRPAVICRDPGEAGLVRNMGGRWKFPQTEDGTARLAALSAARAQSKMT